MVRYRLKEKKDSLYKYEYFPQGDFSKKAGFIVVDMSVESVYIEKVADDDFECRVTVKELKKLREAENEMRAENGEPPLIEEEWSSSKGDSSWYYYVNHAIDKLCDSFSSGKILTEGTATWY